MFNTNEHKQMDEMDSMDYCPIEQGEAIGGIGNQLGESISELASPQDGEPQLSPRADDGTDELLTHPSHESQSECSVTSPPEEDATMRVIRLYPKVCQRIASLMAERAESIALDIIEKGLGYDDAVADAHQGGYLQGKNEKIELVKSHRMPQLDSFQQEKDENSHTRGIFPQYTKKPFWD